ncbi:MAG: hypothetical protein ACLPYS_18310 [Vulcanimicrobiaceae bacterium]
MSSRSIALASAGACTALVLAQDLVPTWAGFHTWQYAAVLVLLGVTLVACAQEARAGRDGEVGAKLVFALIGALVVAAAGLASGLLGPDSETIVRAPGTVAPLPDVGAAAFFSNADAAAIARGDAHVLLRQKSGSFDLGPGARHFVGATLLELRPQLAAYVEARDEQGRHLTITQPTNAAFLSPILLFPGSVPIAGQMLPADQFAAPAVHRQIKAFYFSKSATAAAKAHGFSGNEAILFAVDDDRDELVPGGIGFAQSGSEVSLGGVRLQATLGTYPALVISAVPYPPVLWLGLVTFIAGLGFAFFRPGPVLPSRVASESKA